MLEKFNQAKKQEEADKKYVIDHPIPNENQREFIIKNPKKNSVHKATSNFAIKKDIKGMKIGNTSEFQFK